MKNEFESKLTQGLELALKKLVNESRLKKEKLIFMKDGKIIEKIPSLQDFAQK